MKRKILLLLVLLIGIVLLLGACRKQTSGSGRVTLTYYKLFDEEDTVRSAIDVYQKQHSNVTIRYRKFTDPEAYEDLILNELAEGEGPDVFEITNASLPRFFKKIKPLASEVYTPKVFRDTYVSIASDDFIKTDPADGKEKIYGVPLTVDTPVLYFNKALYEAKIPERGKPPALWDDMVQDALLLREESTEEGAAAKSLIRGALAFGKGKMIGSSVNALLNLMLQEGVSFYDDALKRATFASREGEKALEFYLSFGDSRKKQYSWDDSMVNSNSTLKEVEAFLTGKIVAILGYSDLNEMLDIYIKNLKAKGFDVISKDDIGISPLPQLSENVEDKVVLGRYTAQTVSRTTKNAFAAWDFIAFLTSRDQAKRYLEKTEKPAARRDLIEIQKQDPVLSVFVSQVGFAKGIPFFNERKLQALLEDGIQNAALGQNPGAVLKQIQETVNSSVPPDGLFPKYVPRRAPRP